MKKIHKKPKSQPKKDPPQKLWPPDCLPMPDFESLNKKVAPNLIPDGCWHMPDYFLRVEPKLKERKFCCFYPDESACLVDQIIPNFDHIKGLYTMCDYQLEACVNEQLIRVRDLLLEYRATQKEELLLQSELCERLINLQRRYKHLTSDGVCVKLYPEIVSVPVERLTVCDIKEIRKSIEQSNCRLIRLMAEIAEAFEELDRRYERLDLTVESVFLSGDWGCLSYDRKRELLDDMHDNFWSYLELLKVQSKLLQPGDLATSARYHALVKSKLVGSNEFNIKLMFLDNFGKCMNMRGSNSYPYMKRLGIFEEFKDENL